MRLGLICLVWLVSCASALAGPWPREKGSFFTSASVESPEDGDTRELYYSAYAEYGMTDWLTLGFDGGTDYYTNGEGYAFARVPIPVELGPHKFAVLGGVGARMDESTLMERIYVLGASWGMGFESPLGPGWATLDGTLRHRRTSDSRLAKLDATLGLNRESGQLWFAQLRYSNDTLAEEPIWEVAPSIAWPLWGAAKLETSASFGLQGSDQIKLKLGLWLEF
ncbi:hypothetical protein [Tropicimonas sp. S265A]|uniref:hypothetical protein n=1 Tax=Tropicimonas sp. S265A TaxID=3415134 RepID=UPI003C7E059C